MQSLIERANNGGHFDNSNSRQWWKYDWYTPSHHANSSGSGNANSDGNQFSDNSVVEKYPFNYKTWIKSDVCIWQDLLKANDSLDLLDASSYSAQEQADAAVAHSQQMANRPANGDSLTAEDIRGAVGGVGTISGLSSSDAQQTTREEAKPKEETKPNPSQDEKHDVEMDKN
ncbi:RTT102 (YGR275W) [Zygosaccharomyces parabailii]|uniref:ZYBA0S07-02498g1_1 n=1 Tax=Zygosaccharomyces bailii (strain CLIB 213 / ATCC 58445 / CBS 680 / BCRC 21525 / NBRC 1098 / NCYC 1416 / NRRL Y-2227) TaxID=1333698 RepID=A0A8J2T8T5_ZYGB2|nr:RTT102 (YGR275W) [Zygosaccharomyces parabailii]CDF90501.1 ZYBA0S07-02498g1_1 [Zygosaccharomyces bailii CLIB 213]CDH15131.1 uncharacterized protein ZBAI_06918 [Zygosaccharomyces bailii ISA1307]SJM84061.1 uncharacterized protein ZBIST_1436 [Zygosaccharomyces bailii]